MLQVVTIWIIIKKCIQTDRLFVRSNIFLCGGDCFSNSSWAYNEKYKKNSYTRGCP